MYATPKSPEPRAHHFVPQCWLSGFTDSGKKDGRLFVTDIKRQRQWQTSPPNAGHKRDFYRVPEFEDPIFFEKAFSKFEGSLAPVLKSLYESPRRPTIDELESLLYFAAIQFIRVPSFRPTLQRIAEGIHREMLGKALASESSWKQFLIEADIPLDAKGASFEEMLKFQREVIETGQYSFLAGNDFFLVRGFQVAAEAIVPSLIDRHWGSIISAKGEFIGCDNPVSMDGPPNRTIGFRSATVIVFTVNRHLILFGTNGRGRPAIETKKLAAFHNTFAMLSADEQLYSHLPDFCWLDELGHFNHDWRLFSKERVTRYMSPSIG